MGTVMKRTLISAAALLVTCCLPAFSKADELVVGQPASHEYKQLELDPGRKAIITVYLQTAGGELTGFKVQLVNVDTGELVGSQITDSSGTIVFPDIAAGKYDIDLKKEGDKVMDVYVSIGDYVLSLAPLPTPKKAEKPEEKPTMPEQKSRTEDEEVAEEKRVQSAPATAKAANRKAKEITINLGEQNSGT